MNPVKIVGCGSPCQLEGQSIQTDATQQFSTPLRQGGEDAAHLTGGQEVTLLRLALDVYPPTRGLEASLATTRHPDHE